MGIMRSDKSIQCLLLHLLVPLLMLPQTAFAAFNLQFNPYLPTTTVCGISCTVPGGNTDSAPQGVLSNFNDGSRFIQERLLIDGTYYFHVVVGSPDTNFALESFVATTVAGASNIQEQSASIRPFSPNSGGNEQAVLGNIDLSGSNLGNNGIFGNSDDPLGVSVNPASGFKGYDLSGNGTTDPRRVALRMLVSDADVTVEVLKPMLERKPLITQTTSDGEMSALFQADMRGLSYSDASRAAPVINTLTLTSTDLPANGIGNFDMSMVQRSNVTAGRYTYQQGQGWLTRTPDGSGGYIYTDNPDGWDVANSVYDEGSYTYTNGTGGFNVYGANWDSYFNHESNQPYCDPNDNGGARQGNRSALSCPGF